MSDDPRIQQLLEELLDSDSTPEAVCKSCPELLSEVRGRWLEVRRLCADLNSFFPPLDEAILCPPDATDLPRIPGYEIEAVIARGGMGVVFRGRHLRLGRPVAIKMMLSGAYAGPREKDRFQREARSVAELGHSNVVQIFDIGDADGRPYFTMEFVEGGSLSQKLAGAPQPARQAAQLVTTLAGAVQAAHTRGIVHRDLKPANVMLAADGTPKIGDFGLARRQDDPVGLTQSGVAIGTPSYMAPEQALGRPDALGPAVDVYALGAILYELLTGRPPFRAATAAETVQQVISQEPAPPSRLNQTVPRDLEIICLKCLHKEPGRRYASAAALADDLTRFGEGRPIQARPVGWMERTWRWGRRNPAAAALLMTVVALTGLAVGGGMWLAQQRGVRRAEAAQRDKQLRGEIDTAVTQSVGLRQGFHFREARQLLEQARQRLEPAGPEDLRRQVDQARVDLALVQDLDTARIRAWTLVEEKFQPADSDRLFASALAEAGLGQEGDDVETVASRVRSSPVRAEIVAGLDAWAGLTVDSSRRKWLLAVACKADPDPVRDRLRQPELWQDGVQLAQLVQQLGVGEVPPLLASALGRMTRTSGADVEPLLTAALARFPQDFWLNFELGWALAQAKRSDEAIGYYRAALALRPQTTAAHNNLGMALYDLGRHDEAIAHYRQALRNEPESASANVNLGSALCDQGRQDEAVPHFEQAVRSEPESLIARLFLGQAMLDAGRPDEAIDHFEQALRIEPTYTVVHINLGMVLYNKGRLDEAIDHYEQALRIEPTSIAGHINLAAALTTIGRLDEAIDHYEQALRIEPTSTAGHINLGVALYNKGRLDEAIDQFQQALRIDPAAEAAQLWLCDSSYLAARAAVREATGEGSGSLGAPERAEKLQRAMTLLRICLEMTTSLRNDGKVVDVPLSDWQSHPDLAGVRDPEALAKLPDAQREQWQRLWADVSAAMAADPVEQGGAHIARREWKQAADCYARSLTLGPTDDGHFWFEYAAVRLLSGDRSGYAEACTHMVEACNKSRGPRGYHVARACTLAPDAVADPSLPGRLAAGELETAAAQFWSLTEQGALAYRAGRFQDAVPLFEQSLKADTQPGRTVVNWLWLALAHQRLDKPEEARRWLGEAQAWLNQFKDGMPASADAEFGLHLHNWLEAHVLLREAEALLAPP